MGAYDLRGIGALISGIPCSAGSLIRGVRIPREVEYDDPVNGVSIGLE